MPPDVLVQRDSCLRPLTLIALTLVVVIGSRGVMSPQVGVGHSPEACGVVLVWAAAYLSAQQICSPLEHRR